MDVSVSGKRASLLEEVAPDQLETVERLLRLAPRGLRTAYRPDTGGFAQTVRRTPGPRGDRVRPEGDSLRYAAIAALGLNRTTPEVQRAVLDGGDARTLAAHVAERARTATDPGAVALAAWASAEVAGERADDLLAWLLDLVRSDRPVPVVDLSWTVVAAVAGGVGGSEDLLARASRALLATQGPGGAFPHVSPATGQSWWRRHVSSFADQVYPVQAFTRAHGVTRDPRLLEAANRTAAVICRLQGGAGQWWWHYDARTAEVVERFPVYSVHQHAMAPMVLLELGEAGGDVHASEVAAGLRWLGAPPELAPPERRGLVDSQHGLVWRKVGRREPRRAARALAAASTRVRPGTALPGVDRLMPPGVIDHECRPYELGWLLYAWSATTPGAGDE